MHNNTAIMTGSANQRSNTPCIRMLIDAIINTPRYSQLIQLLYSLYSVRRTVYSFYVFLKQKKKKFGHPGEPP